MEKWLIGGVYILGWLLMIPSVVIGRYANLHDPSKGVDPTLAWWALAFGLLSNAAFAGFMLYVFFNAMSYKG